MYRNFLGFRIGKLGNLNKELSLIIFRYLLKELVPQFLSALVVICAIIVVSQLVRLSEVLVTFGLSLENLFLPFLYIILPFLSTTIPIAYLFAVLLTFARLSADGEYAALLASGYSLRRCAKPVILVGAILYGCGTICAVNLEAWGRRELVQFLYRKTQTELDNILRYKLQPGVFLEDFLGYVLYAEKISSDRTHFENVLLAPGSRSKGGPFTLLAPEGGITGSVETGDLKLTLSRGVSYASEPGAEDGTGVTILKFKSMDLDILRIFREQIIGADDADDDFRSYRVSELRRFINDLAQINEPTQEERNTLLRATYLFHQRIASPFAVVTFALFGMVLGVSDPRRGKSSGYVGGIITIMLGYVFMMAFKWLAEKGQIPAYLAAWSPNLLLLVVGSFLAWQKHRLPPSEPTLAWENMPWRSRVGNAVVDSGGK